MYILLYPFVSSSTVNLASPLLHRNKAPWESEEQPVHPGATLKKHHASAKPKASSQKVVLLVSFNPNHLKQIGLLLLAVLPWQPHAPCGPEACQGWGSAYTGNTEHSTSYHNSFLKLCAEVSSVVIPKLVSEKMLYITLLQAISGLSLGHLSLHPPTTQLPSSSKPVSPATVG